VRNSGKLTSLAAGTNNRQPTTWINSDTTIVRLYPIDSISLEVGAEKNEVGEKECRFRQHRPRMGQIEDRPEWGTNDMFRW